MPDFIRKYLDQFREFWNSLEKPQKNRIYITSIIVVVAISISIFLISRPKRVVLFTNTDQKQIGEMIGILDDNGIWNSAENNGTSIVIDSKDNNRAQILLAQAGYPKEGFTFEDAISNIGLTTTQQDKEKIWQHQKVSDLERKIELLDNIDEAAVTLATPETSIFLNASSDRPRPTAYVMIRPNKTLSSSQIEGIVMLVSRSVENLDPNDVTIVDNNSNILNVTSSDDSISAANSQEELRKKREGELEQKVLDYFSGGQFESFDTLRVIAHVTLDFDKDKSQTKSIANPDGMEGGAVISSSIREEIVKNGSEGGEPGLGSNPGDTGATGYAGGSGSSSDYSNTQEDINYGYNETLREQEKATGKFIPEDSGIAISLWYGNKVTDDSGLNDEFISEIRTAASTATGVPIANITVSKLKLAPQEIIEESTLDRISELFRDYGFFALMLILIIGLIIVSIPRRRESSSEQAQPVATATGPQFVVPEYDEPLPEIDLEERSEIKKQLDKFVKQKPESVAQLLRNWLSDDWE